MVTRYSIIFLLSYLTLVCIISPTSYANSVHTSAKGTQYTPAIPHVITGSRVNLRREPSLQTGVLKTLTRNTQVNVSAERLVNGMVWANITLPPSNANEKTLQGWMAKRYLSPVSTQAPIQKKQSIRSTANIPAKKKSTERIPLKKKQRSLQNDISLNKHDIQGQIARPQDLHFSILTRGQGTPNVLVFAGIQGDEPGGFSAASLLATHYTFTKGQVTIVPNLNFHSIVRRSRGAHGDMNRKFAALRTNDPQYQDIKRAKQLIQQSDASVIFNLHDGSGFYRPQHENNQRNPKRWGQSIVIDMDYNAGITLPQLANTAKRVATKVNTQLLKRNHTIHVKNTRTDKGNIEMVKTLTWFALRQGKAAFAIEASKSFDVATRAYYHLHMLEAFFNELGIQFERTFHLTPQGIHTALRENVFFAFNNGRVRLPLQNIRRTHQTPMSLPRDQKAIVSSPILAATYLDDHQNRLQVHYGNNRLTQFPVRWRDVDTSLPSVTLNVDGTVQTVYMGEIINVNNSFRFVPLERHSIHPIGTNIILPPKNTKSTPFAKELTFSKKDFTSHASLDKHATMYRIEFLQDDKLAGTLIIHFTPLTRSAMVSTQKTKASMQP